MRRTITAPTTTPRIRVLTRTPLVLALSMAALLCSDQALADSEAKRLYGNYRGPEDAQAADTTVEEIEPEVREETGADDGGIGAAEGAGGEPAGPQGGGGGGGAGGTGGGGGGYVGGGGGGGGSGSSVDSGGGGGGGAPPAAPGSGQAPSGGGGSVGGGGFGSGRSASSANERFELVSWYWEHNKEHQLATLAEDRNRRVALPDASAVRVFGAMPDDTRVRSPITPGDRARIFDILESATVDEQAIVRDTAVIALGKLGGEEAVDVLLERVSRETSLAVKQDTLLALGLTGSPDVVEPLIKRLEQRNLTAFAALGLGLTGDRKKAAPAVLARFRALAESPGFDRERACLAIALGALAYEVAVPDLTAALSSNSSARIVQVYSAHALGRIGGDTAQKALVKALSSAKDEQARRQAALALGEFVNADAAKTLAGKDGIKSSTDELGAGFAAVSLGRVLSALPESEWGKHPEALREIALAPQKSKIRAQYAGLALAQFGGIDDDVRSFYTEELDERTRDAETLSAFCMSVGLAREGGAGTMLADIASSSASDPGLSSYAAQALGMLAGTPADQARQLREICSDSDRADVRRGAISALGLVGDREDVPFLIEVISSAADDWQGRYTRGAAVTAIGRIRDGQSVEQLQALLSSPNGETRAFAVAALGCLGDRDGGPVLSQLVSRNNFREEFDVVKVVLGHL